MRWKIIVVNATILLLVGLLAYALVLSSAKEVLSDATAQKRELAQALRSANGQLKVDALSVERWLDTQAQGSASRNVFQAGTVEARREAATAQANRIRDAAVGDPIFVKMAPTLVLFVNDEGVALGRNGSALMRGEDVAEAYPSLAEALEKGTTASAVWLDRQRQEQMLSSYAPVRNSEGEVVGALVVGTPLNDERMARTSELTTGHSLLFAMAGGENLEVVASAEAGHLLPKVSAVPVTEAATSALKANGVATADGEIADSYVGAVPLSGYSSSDAVLLAAVPTSLVEGISGWLALPIFGVILLGLVLVVVAGFILGNYISRPISELEDGLLAIINGNSNLRFQIEHPELGGLVFRINSLLNALMGVPEDTTDEEGRPSTAPSANTFQEALAVDESSAASQAADPALAAALAAEPPDQYYRRIFNEYVSAKRRLGDPVEHVTMEAFVSRIQENELRMQQKYGRPVRFQVNLRDNSVMITAIPL